MGGVLHFDGKVQMLLFYQFCTRVPCLTNLFALCVATVDFPCKQFQIVPFAPSLAWTLGEKIVVAFASRKILLRCCDVVTSVKGNLCRSETNCFYPPFRVFLLYPANSQGLCDFAKVFQIIPVK